MSERFGNYEILRKIAAGGMAEVFLAKHTGIGGFERLVCIKRILPHLGEQEDFISMFQDEARIAANLTHPNVAQIYDIDKADGAYYIAMEYVRGEDLRRIYNAEVTKGRAMPTRQAAQIVMYAAAGLDYAHRQTTIDGRPLGIVHRDISPQNVLVTYDGHVKIVDFGVAKAAIKMTETRTGVLKGKYSYMSPEQASGDPIDARTDIFALGITLYEVTTGTRLFKRENELETLHAVIECSIKPPSDIIPGYDPDLEAILLRALAYDPDDRFSTAGDLERELERYLVARQQPTSSSSIGVYMQDLFAEKLADELLFGGEPWEEQNTSSENVAKARKKKPQPSEALPSLVLDDTEISDSLGLGAAAAAFDEDDDKTLITDEKKSNDKKSSDKEGRREQVNDEKASTGWTSPGEAKKEPDHWAEVASGPRGWELADSHTGSLTATQGAASLHKPPKKRRSTKSAPPPPPMEVSVSRPPSHQRYKHHKAGRAKGSLPLLPLAGGVVLSVALIALVLMKLFSGGEVERSGPLTIDSEPRGARLQFFGLGADALTKAYAEQRTPVTINEGLPVENAFFVNVSKDGFDVARIDIPVLEAGVVPRPIFVELMPENQGSETAALQLRTTPAGAEVWIDNRKIEGVTPLDDLRVSGGEMHRIEFRKWGHKTTSETRFVEPGSRVFVDKVLQPVDGATPLPDVNAVSLTSPTTGSAAPNAGSALPGPGTLPKPQHGLITPPDPPKTTRPTKRAGKGTMSITSSMKLRVSVGSRYLGETPIRRLSLSAGLYRLKLESRQEGFVLRRKVRLGAGRSESLNVQPAKGVLSVNATPWAWVRLGRKAAAETPVRMTVYEGEYRVGFECPDGRKMKQAVQVRPGKTATLKVDCRK